MNTQRQELSRDERLGKILAEWLEACERGDTPDAKDYLRRYPDFAAELRQHFADWQRFPRVAQSEPLPRPLGDYELLRELGRGGMGVVYEARQISLDRRVALKVLPFAATMDAKQLQRFHNEARAAAALEHPHIVPVYGVGCERGVHYYAMRLIEGQTLAGLIAATPTQAGNTTPVDAQIDTTPTAADTTGQPPRDAAFFRRAAEWGRQAAEALEYAHSLGIVHRDIKPANLLISPCRGRGRYSDPGGADAETPHLWVTDFGLARTAADAGLTLTGDLLGTLRYMSPEQALAKHGLVDHRTDIYALGATLYELVTGQPAVEGNERRDILHNLADSDPRPPSQWTRAIPTELETIILKALSKEPDARYASAKEMAEDLGNFLEDRPIRARRPSLWQKAAKWARRNRAAVIAASVAAIVIATVLGAAAGISYQREESRIALEREKLQFRQDQLEKDLTRLLDDVDAQRAKIHAKLADPIKVCELMSDIDGWQGSLAKARDGWTLADALAASNQDVVTVQMAERLRQVDEQLQADETDWRDAKKLDDIRLEAGTLADGNWNPRSVGPIYGKFFLDRGLNWKTNKPAELASRIRQEKLRYILVGALDDWCRNSTKNATSHWLLETARLADPDPWRDKVRDRKMLSDKRALAQLARDVDVLRQSPQHLTLLAACLTKEDSPSLLRAGLHAYPQDFWLHFDLGYSLKNPDQRIGCFLACLALRPRNVMAHNNLGHALREKKDIEGAIQEYRKAIEIDAQFVMPRNNLGIALLDKKDLDGAIHEFRKAIGIDPQFAVTHNNLGNALRHKKDLDGAIREYRSAIRLDPNHAAPHNNLGIALEGKSDLDGAIREWQRAMALDPTLPDPHYNLGNLLRFRKKDLDGAVREWRKAIEVDPSFFKAYTNLGVALVDKNDLEGAIWHHRKAVELAPNSAISRNSLGAALATKKELDGAIREFRKAIELDPNLANAHAGLGTALLDKNELEGAIRELRKAIELDPKPAWPHFHLGRALRGTNDLDGAIEQYRAAIQSNGLFAEAHINLAYILEAKGQFAEALKHRRLGHTIGSKHPGWRYPSAKWVQDCERLVKLDQEVPALLKGDIEPESLQMWLAYLDVCQRKKDSASIAGIWKLAFRENARVSGNVGAEKREQGHEVKVQAGKTYVIDLESKAFDTFLRLHDAQGKKLGENDDIAPGLNTNSRLIFTPRQAGAYRLFVSAFENNGVGPYTLTVREFVK